MRMHADQLDIDVALVRRLIAEQFPQWAQLPVRAVASAGTVNAVYRLGDRLSVRLPLVAGSMPGLMRETTWLPLLAPGIDMTIPTPVAVGGATGSYPFPWAVYEWIDGRPYGVQPNDGQPYNGASDPEWDAVTDLARFIAQLRQTRTAGAPAAGRAPLRELDDPTRESIADAASDIDASSAVAAWERSLAAPEFDGVPVWIHADLLRPNLLVRDGRIRAVIDWGSAGVGDPAADVIAAWTVFGPAGRRRFRDAVGVDDASWERARGYALHQAVALIPYYRSSNPAMTAVGLRTVGQVLFDE